MFERTCIECNNEYTTGNYRQKKCRKDCGRTRTRARGNESFDYRFVGVDGEGVDRPDGNHEYVMLSVGNRTLYGDGNILDTREIFAFLYDAFTDEPEAVYIGFFLGYDFIQWERGLPQRVAESLLLSEGISRRTSSKRGASPYPDPVVWEGWEFDILAGRRWKLRPHHHRQSRYYGDCRNRTCDYQFDRARESLGIAHEEPRWLPFGEELYSIENYTESGDLWDGLPEEEFWHRFAVHGVSTEQPAPVRDDKWMYICDTGPFWQSSFLNVINPKGWDTPVCSKAEYALVEAGKSDRGITVEYGDSTLAGTVDDMQQYNVLENDILGRVTERLNRGFLNDHIPIRIKPQDWYGPGRAAQTWIDMLSSRCADPTALERNKDLRRDQREGRRLDVKRENEYSLRNEDVYLSMPDWAQLAAQRTYYGGWFEQFLHGHVGHVWEYDINSAYPAVIATLPCLHVDGDHTGEWTQGEGDTCPLDSESYTIVHATIVGSNSYIGAMPHRNGKGNISRPQNVEGWYWLHEINASRNAHLIDEVQIHEWVSLHPCDCPAPFNPDDIGIGRMYDLRLEVGKNSPQGKGFKLVYNSAYGKTAQSIGNPKYSNPLYASLITAGCRVQILDAIATHPVGAGAVSMVATDGVYFTSPHPTLELSPSVLGLWDVTEKRNLTQLMPGVYWDDSSREAIREKQGLKLKSRGVNARDLANQIDWLDDAFHRASEQLDSASVYEWPELRFAVRFLLTSAKSSLRRNNWQLAGAVEHDTTRQISSNPQSKRYPVPYLDGEVVRTIPYPSMPIPSVDYHKTFGYQEFSALDDAFAGYVALDGRDPLAWVTEFLNDGVL